MNPVSPPSPTDEAGHSTLGISASGNVGYSSSHIKKKRVGKACDSCRIKKTKCDGKKPCNRCIIDNKICVFTEKKKPKEKNHPQGYVELLETRLDILTKSLEKLIELSRPSLPFLEEILQDGKRTRRMKTEFESDSNDELLSDEDSQSPGTQTRVKKEKDFSIDELDHNSTVVPDEDSIPINRVVSYLINSEGLLNNLPVEWEAGAMLAANYVPKNMDKYLKVFAEHKLNVTEKNEIENHNHNHTEFGPSPSSLAVHRDQLFQHSQFSNKRQNNQVAVKREDDHPVLYEDGEDMAITSPTASALLQTSLTEQLNLNEFSLGGFSSGGLVVAGTGHFENANNTNSLSSYASSNNDFTMSDIDTDSVSSYSQGQLHHGKMPSHQISQIQNHQLQSQKFIKSASISPAEIENFPRRANSIFLSNSQGCEGQPPSSVTKSGSISSLTSKYENHNLAMPVSSATPPPETLRRSSSSLIQRPCSPSHQKAKNSGHVHKAQFHPHSLSNKSSTSGTVVSNNGNEFHISGNYIGKRLSYSSVSSTNSNATTPSIIVAHTTPTLFGGSSTVTTSLSPQNQGFPFYDNQDSSKDFDNFVLTFDELPSTAFKINPTIHESP